MPSLKDLGSGVKMAGWDTSRINKQAGLHTLHAKSVRKELRIRDRPVSRMASVALERAPRLWAPVASVGCRVGQRGVD